MRADQRRWPAHQQQNRLSCDPPLTNIGVSPISRFAVLQNACTRVRRRRPLLDSTCHGTLQAEVRSRCPMDATRYCSFLPGSLPLLSEYRPKLAARHSTPRLTNHNGPAWRHSPRHSLVTRMPVGAHTGRDSACIRIGAHACCERPASWRVGAVRRHSGTLDMIWPLQPRRTRARECSRGA
jgi:hypothetical protein